MYTMEWGATTVRPAGRDERSFQDRNQSPETNRNDMYERRRHDDSRVFLQRLERFQSFPPVTMMDVDPAMMVRWREW